MTGAPAGPTDRGPSDAPVTRLTVLYDRGCPLCRHVRGWLERQRTLVPLDFVPAGTPQARQRFPVLDHARTLREITVIGNGGQVYEGAAAWVVVLWALRAFRPTAHRLSSPAGAQLARGMVLAAAKWRQSSRASAPRPGTVRRPATAPRRPVAASGRSAPASRRPAAPCEGHCAGDGG